MQVIKVLSDIRRVCRALKIDRWPISRSLLESKSRGRQQAARANEAHVCALCSEESGRTVHCTTPCRSRRPGLDSPQSQLHELHSTLGGCSAYRKAKQLVLGLKRCIIVFPRGGATVDARVRVVEAASGVDRGVELHEFLDCGMFQTELTFHHRFATLINCLSS
jgi:hypothetical protein